MKNKKGFSLVELIVVIAILAVLIAVLAPSLIRYTENSRAQKDASAMDELVNAVQLTLADDRCYDEAIKYSVANNFITYTDSSGQYGTQMADEEFYAPDGRGKATTITFNPEKNESGHMIYRLSNALVNDMTHGNGSVADERSIEGAQTEDVQCRFEDLTLLYNGVRRIVGDIVEPSSATYRNSSFTIFIQFSQKDGIKTADVRGMYNGTNLHEGCKAAIGSGTTEYDEETEEPITGTGTQGTIDAEYESTALGGDVSVNNGGGANIPNYKLNVTGKIPNGAVYHHNVERYFDEDIGDYVYEGETILNAGESFPTEPLVGDVFIYGDYEYAYGVTGCSCFVWPENCCYDPIDGWGVKCINNTKKPGTILTSICGKPILSISAAFYEMDQIVYAPSIPDTVTNMAESFWNCSSLKTTPVFPKNLKDMFLAFEGCTSLTKSMPIPSNVVSVEGAFANCTSLTGTIKIESNVIEYYDGCFSCTEQPIVLDGESFTLHRIALTAENGNVTVAGSMPLIPEGGWYFHDKQPDGTYSYLLTYNNADTFPEEPMAGDVYCYGDYEYHYEDFYCDDYGWGVEDGFYYESDAIKESWGVRCVNNVKAPGKILSKIAGKPVTMMEACFIGMDKMEVSPEIPSTIVTLKDAYACCTNLKSAPIIPNGVTNMFNTFYGCEQLTTMPIIPYSVTDLSYAFYGCEGLTSTKTIPSSVTNMECTFRNCSSLAGGVTVHANPTRYSSCFAGTQVTEILGNTELKAELLATVS